MPGLFHAILAYSLLTASVAGAIASSAPSAPRAKSPGIAISELANPELSIPVTFTLIDGTRITGTLTRWNESTFDGSFGNRHWHELTYRDAWRILHRLIDRDVPDDWLLLARIMLILSLDQPDAQPWAERAFRHARRVAGENEMDAIDARIKDIRAEHEAKKQARTEREHDLDPARLRTRTPEADDWPSAPWPELSRNEQRNAVLTKKNDAKQAFATIDLDLAPIETASVLFYTDLDRPQAVRIAMRFDEIIGELAKLLHTNPRANPFWGKAVLIILTSRERYDTLQSDAFGFIAPGNGQGAGTGGAVPGLVHPIGPKVFITLHYPGRAAEREFERELSRLIVRAVLHRHISPRRLPPWANDGLGMVVADRLHFDGSPVIQQHRRDALGFLRTLNDPEALLELIHMTYADERWPALELRIASLGGLLIELMVREKPREFVAWVEAVKNSADWRDALEDTYRVKLDVLLDTAVRYYRVND